MRRLGGGRIESAERDIVGACFPGLHREMAAVMTGLADLRRRPEQRPRLAHVAVGLPEVHPVGTDALGEAHAVVDDEGDTRVGADALQRIGETRKLMLVHVLHPKLEGRC